jgi:hypothetical protein
MTWQQVVAFHAVSDLGDPLFSIWRLSWVAHQLPRDPLHLFDANIFFPELRTLAYSDAMLVPALLAAPFIWLGSVAHNACRSRFASGVAIRARPALTGTRRRVRAGVAFAFPVPVRATATGTPGAMPLALLMPIAAIGARRGARRSR